MLSMADTPKIMFASFVFLSSLLVLHASSTPVNIPLRSVPDLLLQSALNSLNDSSTHHTYKSGILVRASQLLKPYVIYTLTLDLELNCNEATCPREVCAIGLHQQQDVIVVENGSIACIYPQSPQDEIQQHVQENVQDKANADEIESFEKQIVNESVQLDHEVQTVVTDGSDRPFIAVRATDRNYCAGCPFELNRTLSGLSAFGEQVVQSMDDSGRSDYKHKVISIVRVTRAVPPGSNVVQYKLHLEIGETNCLRSSLLQRSECTLTDIPKLCLVTFEERPWQQNSRKITRNNCTDSPDSNNEVNERTEPQLASESLMTFLSSHTRVPTSDVNSRVDQITQEGKLGTFASSIDAFVNNIEPTEATGSLNGETRDPINEESITKVVLSTGNDEERTTGFEDKIKEFDAFLEDFDIPIKSRAPEPENRGVPVTEEVVRPKVVPRPSVQREGSISSAGEESTRTRRSLIDTLEAEGKLVRKLAQKALNVLDDIDVDNNKRVVLGVLDSKKEEADGTVYHIRMKVAPTDCDEKHERVAVDCLDGIREPAKICNVQIHTNSEGHLDTAKVLQLHCVPEQKKRETGVRRQIDGARRQNSIDDPEIRAYAEKGLNKFSEITDSENEPFLIEITEATAQVDGRLRIKVKLGESNCTKGTNENCQLKSNGETKNCLITVWYHRLMDEGNPEVTIKCSPQTRERRSLRGVNYSTKMLNLRKKIKHEEAFESFISKYEKVYTSDEEKNARFEIFKKNMKVIENLRKNEQGTAVYGASIFADIAPEEFSAKYMGLKPELRSENDIPLPQAEIPDIELPAEFDWRKHNVVTEVKNQGQCGSCWAFAVTGNIEGLYAIKTGKLLSLSEQELVDCDKLDQGCEGGLPDNAYKAIEGLGGLELETDYPYDAEDEKCHFDKAKARVNIVSGVNITTNETGMAQWLVKNGPISIGINANAMQFYMGGVSHPFKFLCNGDNLDHGVLIVGYGVHRYPIFNNTMPFWTIKNSWGPRWGEEGYYRVYRGDGTCGLNRMASSAVLGEARQLNDNVVTRF